MRPQVISSAEISLPRPKEEGWHTQPANEFLLILEGKGVHRTFLGEQEFSAGDIHFFPRGQLHEHAKSSVACKCLTVRFRDEAFAADDPVDAEAHHWLAGLKQHAHLGRNRLELSPTSARKLRALFRQAVAENATAQAGSRVMLKAIALEALVLISRESAMSLADEESPGKMADVFAYIDAHAAERISVEQMLEIACLSRSHFHATFKRLTGTTLFEHVTRIRVGMAALELGTSNLPLEEIAYQCGFAGISRLYEAFKRYRGHTPGSLRRG
jgi:AraC-like DNA-binding protein